MGWGDCGNDSQGRPIAYANQATCDHPGCEEKIDRGLAFACGGMHGENDGDCEGYFCDKHLFSVEDPDERLHSARLCETCKNHWNEYLVEDLIERIKELEAEKPQNGVERMTSTHFSDCSIFDESGSEIPGGKCDCGGAVEDKPGSSITIMGDARKGAIGREAPNTDNNSAPTPSPASEAYQNVKEALAFYANTQNWWCRNADGLGYHQADLSGSMERLNAQVGVVEHRPHFVHEQFYNDCGKRGEEALAALPALKPQRRAFAPEPDVCPHDNHAKDCTVCNPGGEVP